MKRRDANLILVSLAAAGGTVFAYSFPSDLLELLVKSSGLPAIVPAAAPPLGDTARLIFVAVAGCGASALTARLLPWNGRKGGKARGGARSMTFQFSRLKALMSLRKTADAEVAEFDLTAMSVDPIPVLRRSDAHPDAPPRPPLFASRDLGHDALPPIHAGNDDGEDMESDMGGDMGIAMRPVEDPCDPIVKDITGLAMPRAPEPLPWDTVQVEMDRLLSGVRFRAVEDVSIDKTPNGVDAEPVEPTINELISRLEQGIAKLSHAIDRNPPPSTTAPLPVAPGYADTSFINASPMSPVADLSDQDDDKQAGWSTDTLAYADLGTALAALRGITARAG